MRPVETKPIEPIVYPNKNTIAYDILESHCK